MLAEIEDILYNRTIESSRVEYKEGWNPEKVLHTICAFANDIDNIGGGYIILGVEANNGIPILPPKGLDAEQIDIINRELLNICNEIEPRYIPTTQHAVIDGRNILAIEVIVGSNRPYKCPNRISKDKSKHTGKSYYVRKLASTIVAGPDEERELFNVSNGIPFDCRVCMTAGETDILPSLVFEYLSKINPEECERVKELPFRTVCTNLKILGEPPYDSKPINAGILFFNNRPTDFIESARIEIVDLPDPTGTGMTETILDGPLDMQLEGAMGYLRNQVIKVMTIKHPHTPVADRIYNYPESALEEALVNAVYHKDYSINEPVTVTIKPDRICILSIPGPNRDISDDDLKSFNISSVRYRNARIGDLLKHRELAEKRGTGIPTMVKSLENNGSPAPIFETDPDRSFFRVTIMIHERFKKPESATVGAAPRRSQDDLILEILAILRDNGSMSMRDITSALGYSRNARNVYSAVRTLVEAGKVEYVYPDKMSSRNQRIRLKLRRTCAPRIRSQSESRVDLSDSDQNT